MYEKECNQTDVSGENFEFGEALRMNISYDDTGTRVLKTGRFGEVAYVNSNYSIRNGEVATKHVFAGNTRVLSKMVETKDGKESESAFYYESNHIGSSSTITDKKGQFYQHIEYFPYGETWIDDRQADDTIVHRFTGQEFDKETSLYNYKARQYDPVLAKFASPDPAGQHLNLYMYCRNNPLTYVDPSGMYDEVKSPSWDLKGYEATRAPGGGKTSPGRDKSPSMQAPQSPQSNNGSVTSMGHPNMESMGDWQSYVDRPSIKPEYKRETFADKDWIFAVASTQFGVGPLAFETGSSYLIDPENGNYHYWYYSSMGVGYGFGYSAQLEVGLFEATKNPHIWMSDWSVSVSAFSAAKWGASGQITSTSFWGNGEFGGSLGPCGGVGAGVAGMGTYSYYLGKGNVLSLPPEVKDAIKGYLKIQ